MESPQSLLAAIAAALRAAGMHDKASRVEADSVTVEHDRDAAVILWQWLADAPKHMPGVGRYDQLVAAYGDWTRSRHAP